MTIHAETAGGAGYPAPQRVFEVHWGRKLVAGVAFALVAFGVVLMPLLVIGTIGRGNAGVGVMVPLIGVAVGLVGSFIWLVLAVLRPAFEPIFRFRVILAGDTVALRLPPRRRAPQQPAYDIGFPLSAIQKIATRTELTRQMGQIMQHRMFALQSTTGVWVELGGFVEKAGGIMAAPAKEPVVQAVAALSAARGLPIEDHGVIEEARKGLAGTPWGAPGLAAPQAGAALVKADKNAALWRKILVAVALVFAIAKAIEVFAR